MSNHVPITPSSITPERPHGGGGVGERNGHANGASAEGRHGTRGGGGFGGDDDMTPSRVRVILVGRTGQDAALRLDRTVELLRAHQPLGAIGELATPMDETSPKLATVIVAPDVVEDDRAREFVSALRRVSPSVRVLAISNANRPEFDGTIPPAITPDALRRLVHSVHGPSVEPALGLDEHDALAVGPRADEDDVLDVLMGGRGGPAEVAGLGGSEERTSPAGRGLSRQRDEAETGLGLADDESDEPADERPSVRLAGEADVEAGEPVGPASVGAGAATPSGPTDGASGAAAVPTVAFAETGVLEALLSGLEAHGPTVEALRRSSGIGDLELIVHDDLAGPEEAKGPPDGPHIKLVHGGVVMGYVRSPSGAHLGRVTPEQRQWASLCLALARKHRQLGEYAFTDELTGAFNRRFFNQFMAEALSRAKAHRQFLTLLYFDIDDFKLYNDRFGHDAGDDILLQTVSLLKSVIRPSDKVCRLGGDEFAVIFYDPAIEHGRTAAKDAPLTDARMGGAPQSIGEIAKRFQRQICEHRFPKLAEGAPGTLTISGGMATFPWDGLTADELLRRADELLLQSKAQGKNLITLGPGARQVCELGDA